MTNNSIFSPLNLDFKQQLLLTNYDLSVMGIYLYVLYDVLVEWRIIQHFWDAIYILYGYIQLTKQIFMQILGIDVEGHFVFTGH